MFLIFHNKKQTYSVRFFSTFVENKVLGTDLLSLMEVPLALKCLTALFGMGRGVTTSRKAPRTLSSTCLTYNLPLTTHNKKRIHVVSYQLSVVSYCQISNS